MDISKVLKGSYIFLYSTGAGNSIQHKTDFYFNTQSLVVFPEVPFNWKLLPIGIVSVKGI